MTTKDVLALALEALAKSKSALAEELAAWDIDPPLHHVNEAHDLCDAAITAIKQAQQAQETVEPFAWFAFADSNGLVPLELFGWDEKACKHAVLTNARSVGWKGTLEGYLYQQGWTIKPVYTHPAPKQAQEPVGINGLTEAETSASMSVMGLSKPAQQAEPAEKRKLYECTGCGHLHEEKPSSCDCCENPANDYNDWTASPTPPEAK